jgi:hypothetical protein
MPRGFPKKDPPYQSESFGRHVEFKGFSDLLVETKAVPRKQIPQKWAAF